jgi:aspartate aminotransferase
MISSRLAEVPVSSIRKLLPSAIEAKAQGVKVHHLNIGDPDIPTPPEMLEVLHSWEAPVIRYAPSRGLPEFLSAMKEYYHTIGHDWVEESDMVKTLWETCLPQIASVGGSEALQWTMFGVANPGEEILVFEPYYSNYNAIAAATGVMLVPLETKIEEGFHLPSREAILVGQNYNPFNNKEKIGPKTKAILYTNPGNPTGANYSQEEIERLVSIAKEKKIFLVSDEPYRLLLYYLT